MNASGRDVRPAWVFAIVASVAASFAHGDSADSAAGPGGPLRGDGPGGVVPAAAGTAKRPATIARRASLAALDTGPLLAEDARSLLDLPGPKGLRIGVVRKTGVLRAPRRLRPGTPGVTALEGGGLAWTMEVAAPGAKGVRLHLARCALPEGATIVAYDAGEPSEAYGPWQGAGPRDAGEFWTPTVFGDRVRLELRVSKDAVGAPILLAVDRVVHVYAEPAAGNAPGPRATPKSGSGSCEVDVQCVSSFASAAHGVARMDFVSGGSSFYCSGALLNDQDATTSTPWFLTANHCISTSSEASSAQFYWDYYAWSCSGSEPSLSSVPRTNGASLVVTSSVSDVTLLRLTGSVPGGRTFLGWTSASPSVGSSITGLHHPAGDVMKVSSGSIVSDQQNFHDVVWTSGVTEGGSSGSPLLLTSSQQVIGQLWGGASYCWNQSGSDQYGRFDVSYPLLKPYINDITGTVTPPPPPPPGGGGGGTPAPGPVGQAPDFFLGLWQIYRLGDGQMHAWRMDILKPVTPPHRAMKLKVEVKGRPHAWVKITDPRGNVTIHPKGKTFIKTIYQGYWPLELHAAEDDVTKILKVKVSKNW